MPCHHIREYLYLYGAVSPVDGELFSLVMPYTNTARMNVFLHEVSKKYNDDYIFMFVDKAAWHRSKELKVPDNIQLYSLLPYTPELNPIEQIWDEIREKGFRNEVFDTLSHVMDRLCATVVSLMDNPAKVASITHREWLINALVF